VIDKAQADAEERVFEIWEENWPAFEMFLRMQTQWVVAGMGELMGLNYQSAEALFRIYRIKDRASMMDDLRVIERAALEAIRRDQKK
jgi:Phage related hypothetical protein (DUF1799)